MLAGAGALAAAGCAPRAAANAFPPGFLWGAATAGHQVEGNNTNADLWLLEHATPTVFAEPSGDAANSLELWARDLDLVKQIGLNTYRFSLEWSRIEPAPGDFSTAMLDHYKAIVAGCHDRGLRAIVTFNHFTAPLWFSARGGWTNSDAPALFARFCDKAARHLEDGLSHAVTMNEPNILRLLKAMSPPPGLLAAQRQMLAAAARTIGVAKFAAANAANFEDLQAMSANMLTGHQQGKAAIKAVRSALPVGVSLAMFDDQAVGEGSIRDAMRAELYGDWLDVARADDFLGVQNYERVRWDAHGLMPPPEGAELNAFGKEIYAPSLAGAVRYAHSVTQKPIIVTEHGVATDDDAVRARFIPAALKELRAAIAEGVPVQGYIHWTLVDNFEWVFGFRPHLGLCALNRETFARTPKPSASVLGAIAQRNAL